MEVTAPDLRNVGTMVFELLLLLLKLTFILGIVSSVFFQVEVGGRSLLWLLVLLLFAAAACAALLLLLLTRWPAVWYLSFYKFPSEECKCLNLGLIKSANTHFDTDLSSNSCDAA